jgi:hypothetical protein
MNLPSDVYTYIFTLAELTLSDIIKLMTVSKQFQRILLLEENWHVISDTHKILYNFVRKKLKMVYLIQPIKSIK